MAGKKEVETKDAKKAQALNDESNKLKSNLEKVLL